MPVTLGDDDIRHIAKLARLKLKDDEVHTTAKELTKILGFIDMLNQVDTEGVEPMAQVTGLSTQLRDDAVTNSEALGDALLACSPLPVEEHQIRSPNAHS